MKDIVMGAVDQLDVADVRNWVKSLKATGFSGEIWMITYRVTDALKAFLADEGVSEYPVEHDYSGYQINHGANTVGTQSHNLRFYHAWELLTRLEVTYENVVMTDVRDVIFQSDPTAYISGNLKLGHCAVASSEGITFGKEEWNQQNLIAGFGQFFYDLSGAETWTVYNVGTLAGVGGFMRNLFHTLHSMTVGRFYPADQSAFNILAHTTLASWFKNETMEFGWWAAQMGTTNDPTKSHLWNSLHELRPVVRNDFLVFNCMNQHPFVIVHQYDRVPGLKEAINDRYR
jgi:hypothetical protein